MSDYQLHHGDLRDVLPTLADLSVDVAIVDPPYSAAVHRSVRTLGKQGKADGNGRMSPCASRRNVDLGFAHLTPALRNAMAVQFARTVRRWVAVFSDVESCHLWRSSLERAGLGYVRTAEWVRIGAAPQFSGDRPSSGFEAITIAHRPGRKRWNGGGKAGTYVHPIVANRNGQQGSRVHETQKPIGLMLDLVDDFSEPGEQILDCCMGSGTTGVAALQRGRRFIGIEKRAHDVATARERLEAAAAGQDVRSRRAGQTQLFGGAKT